MDGVMSLHEILNYNHVKKRVGVVLKLDFEKALMINGAGGLGVSCIMGL